MSYPNYKPSEEEYIYSKRFGYFTKSLMSEDLINFINKVQDNWKTNCIEYIKLDTQDYQICLRKGLNTSFRHFTTEEDVIEYITYYIGGEEIKISDVITNI